MKVTRGERKLTMGDLQKNKDGESASLEGGKTSAMQFYFGRNTNLKNL